MPSYTGPINIENYIADKPIVLRSGVTAPDVQLGLLTTRADVLNPVDCRYVVVDFNVSSDASFVFTPLFWNSVAGRYFKGSSVTVTDQSRYILETLGTEDLYILTGAVSGSTTSATIYATPIKLLV